MILKILETERLLLRQLSTEDAEFIFRITNEPSWIRFIGDKNIRTLGDAREYIENGPMTMYREHGFGLYLVESKDSQQALGLCGLIRRDTLDDVDIGFAFLPEFWRRGYAYEAANATLRHASTALGIERVVAITSPDNEPSGKLLEKLGLRLDRLMETDRDGKPVSLYAPADAGGA